VCFVHVFAGSWSLSGALSKARDSVNKLVKKADDAAPAPDGMSEIVTGASHLCAGIASLAGARQGIKETYLCSGTE